MGLFDIIKGKQQPKSKDIISVMMATPDAAMDNGDYSRAVDTYRAVLELEPNTDDMRKQQIDLFTKYGASVRTVYLETGFEECLSQNAGRKECVPERIIEKLLHSLAVPERYETPKVEWQCV